MDSQIKYSSKALKFQSVKDPSALESLLAGRFPLSANVYNAMKLHKNWEEDQTWLTLKDPVVNDLWIVVTYLRKDYGRACLISRPNRATVTPEVQAAFSNCEFLDWSEGFTFACVDKIVSSMVTEISTQEKGNGTQIFPCNLYTIEPERAMEFSTENSLNIKPIKNIPGTDFFSKTWPYATTGTEDYISKCLNRNPSAGAYINEKEIIAGVILDATGLMGMLYTKKEHRNKGFGRQVMQYQMKSCAENGLIPACTVELRNTVSMEFQEKIGLKTAARVDFVCYDKRVYE